MADEKGSLYERWQYREEMRAEGVLGRFAGLPTAQDYERFNDARNLKDTMDTWLPNEVQRLTLRQMMMSIPYITREEQQRIEDLTNKTIHTALTNSERTELVGLWSKVTPVQETHRDMADPRGFMADAAVAPAPQVYVINDALAASYRHGGAPDVVQAIEKDLHDMQVQGKVWVGDRQGNHLFDVRMGFEGTMAYQAVREQRMAELADTFQREQIPPRGTEAYVRETVLDAIRTGYDEGYPLGSDAIRNIERRVRASEGMTSRESTLNPGQLDTMVRREYGLDLGREEGSVNAFRMYYERHVERETGPGREQGEGQERGR